jgi:S-formylglutathione hydrolase FrmB
LHRADFTRALKRGAQTAVLVAALVAPVAAAGGASADPAPNVMDVSVYSPAMGRDIRLNIIRPNDTSVPRPTLYLLNGAAGGEEPPWDWLVHTDVASFVADKKVNVVIPIGGKQSYYTDWLRDDPVLGRNKWTTFFTQELPPAINSMLGTNGLNAIAGISTMNMWGPEGSPEWLRNDALLNADKLRGTALYISAGNGLPGQFDNLGGRNVEGSPGMLLSQMLVGGSIETIVNACTRALQAKLDSLGIPATYNFRPAGTHSWDYWQDDLHRSWPIIAASLGV